MKDIFKIIWDWSEVWATFIPLAIFIIRKPKEKYLNPIIIYLVAALFLYAFSDVSWKFKSQLPLILKNNNFFYNILSICRLVIFIFFFKQIEINNLKKRFNWLVYTSILLIVFNFIFFADFFNISSSLFTFEAVILLTLSISYFLRILKSDKVNTEFDPSLIIITGLSIYESASFFIFLFFEDFMVTNSTFATVLWRVDKVFYLIFCIFIARALYGRFK